MPIIASELGFFAAEDNSDSATGGGRRGGTALLTGVENNVYPDLTEGDVLQGQTRIRKLYPSVTSAENAALLGATVVLNAPPSDPLVSLSLALYGTDLTVRAQFTGNALPVPTIVSPDNGGSPSAFATLHNGSAVVDVVVNGTALNLVEGDFVVIGTWVTPGSLGGGYAIHLAGVVSTAPDGAEFTMTMSAPWDGVEGASGYLYKLSFAASPRVYGLATTSAEAAATATSVSLDLPLVQLVPVGTVYPTATLGIPPSGLSYSRGMAPVVQAGDLCTLYHEAETAPATQANTDVIDVGRTNLSQMALVDANGDEIDRALANGPSVDASFTVDLAAGTLTCVNVAGWAQPVSVRHRTEERVLVTGADSLGVTLNAPLARTFPAGSVLVSEVPLGDLQAASNTYLFQQAWTRVWSDTVIGSPVGTLYSGAIGLQNDGAEADRWACVFSSATQYTLHSERYGVVGAGNIATDYTPLNPGTGQPLLTLYAANWAPGSISLGNVFRFNTSGAYGRIWALQCASPGAGTGPSAALLRLRGSVDA